MHIPPHNTLSVTVGALQSTPSSNPSISNPKGKEATSESARTPGAINDSLQLSGHDPELAKLKARDREVRAHEAAHSAAAGSLAKGDPSLTFQRGSDGRLYAVGGEVNIDTSTAWEIPKPPSKKLGKSELRPMLLPTPLPKIVPSPPKLHEWKPKPGESCSKNELKKPKRPHTPHRLTSLHQNHRLLTSSPNPLKP
jgi:hypothetical protein